MECCRSGISESSWIEVVENGNKTRDAHCRGGKQVLWWRVDRCIKITHTGNASSAFACVYNLKKQQSDAFKQPARTITHAATPPPARPETFTVGRKRNVIQCKSLQNSFTTVKKEIICPIQATHAQPTRNSVRIYHIEGHHHGQSHREADIVIDISIV